MPIPKPMVGIGGRPILWHIMQHYAAHGYADFVVALGYKGYVIKEYFANQLMHSCDMSVDLSTGSVEYLSRSDGGLEGHPHRHRRGLHDRRPDQAPVAPPRRAVPADLRRRPLRRPHRHGRRPPRVGRRAGDRDRGAPAAALRLARSWPTAWSTDFREKPRDSHDWINGGYFVVEPEVLDLIEGDAMPFEAAPLTDARRPGPPRRLPARRLLDADGHHPRARRAQPDLGVGTAHRG